MTSFSCVAGFIRRTVISMIILLPLAGCTDSDNTDDGITDTVEHYSLSGKVEKGPFVRGSTVSVQPLKADLTTVGSIHNGEITDDTGAFDLGSVELESSLVRIATDGYYFNEVTGSLSTGTLHLVAFANLKDKRTVNVNVLTHLKNARVSRLVASGKSFADADKQATAELLSQFGMENYDKLSAEQITISDGSDGAGVLIAVSSLLLYNRSDAELTQYLSSLSQDLADDGAFTRENISQIAADRKALYSNLSTISSNIQSRYEELGRNVTVPDLRLFFDWNSDGIAGNEINDNPNITLSRDTVRFEKEGGRIQVTVQSDVELSLTHEDVVLSDILVEEPGWSVVEDSYFSGFFENTTSMSGSLRYDVTKNGDVVEITVEEADFFGPKEVVIPLYDLMGIVRASIVVTQSGRTPQPGEGRLHLGSNGKSIVAGALQYFRLAMETSDYVENRHIVSVGSGSSPITPYDSDNSEAFSAAYKSISLLNQTISSLNGYGMEVATPFFRFLRAITYSDMACKWGNIALVLSPEPGMSISQTSQKDVYDLVIRELESMSDSFDDTPAHGLTDDIEQTFYLSKDVWRAALADAYMQTGDYSKAMVLFGQIIGSGRYSVSSDREYENNSGALFILLSDRNQSRMSWETEIVKTGHLPIYSYADVLLSLAECYFHNGDMQSAKRYLNEVAYEKGETLFFASDNEIIANICTLRNKIRAPRHLAFQKRNRLGGYDSKTSLFPIPASELNRNPNWIQNPGY